VIDWVVILTPLLVLAVLLLLGYAGCSFDPTSRPSPLNFYIVVRVAAEPSGEDNVTEITYRCRPPGGPEDPPYVDSDPQPDEVVGQGTDSPVNLYIHSCDTKVVAGCWNVGCIVAVSFGPVGVAVSATADVTVDDATNDHSATFSAEITPEGEFRVDYIGST
jgi:hypothetical protein